MDAIAADISVDRTVGVSKLAGDIQKIQKWIGVGCEYLSQECIRAVGRDPIGVAVVEASQHAQSQNVRIWQMLMNGLNRRQHPVGNFCRSVRRAHIVSSGKSWVPRWRE